MGAAAPENPVRVCASVNTRMPYPAPCEAQVSECKVSSYRRNIREGKMDDRFTFQINYDESTYAVMAYQGNEEHVVIPPEYGGKPVTILFDKLFAGHSEIKSIEIPDTVTDLGEFLFDGCMDLHHIALPTNLLYLWGYTFARCGIEEIVLPDSLKRIPPYAFKECRQLKKVVCGSGLKKIDAWAFGGCENLTEVIHGPNVEISPQAFALNKDIMKV